MNLFLASPYEKTVAWSISVALFITLAWIFNREIVLSRTVRFPASWKNEYANSS